MQFERRVNWLDKRETTRKNMVNDEIISKDNRDKARFTKKESTQWLKGKQGWKSHRRNATIHSSCQLLQNKKKEINKQKTKNTKNHSIPLSPISVNFNEWSWEAGLLEEGLELAILASFSVACCCKWKGWILASRRKLETKKHNFQFDVIGKWSNTCFKTHFKQVYMV